MKKFVSNPKAKETLNKLSSEELENIKFLIEELTSIKKKPFINEDGFRKILNISRQISSFKESYTLRLINLLKQNHMI